MQLTHLFKDDSAVSPVIGVILMVAITVILAAVIGTFVLGLGDQVGDTAPQASFSFDYDDTTPQLVITHESGEAIDPARLTIIGGGLDDVWPDADTGSDDNVDAGDSTTFGSGDSLSVSSGDTIRIVWTSESGSNSATLQTWTYNG
ncbi:type IV pilin [Haloferax marisrubri]|uniref:Type IV pilin n=1 Tax=Haloferax marisrubri TaxID=1544719 RepID=A0A2P4NS81_9EURY|nr:type IV pilin N-terminal domain-containing protein [Haloferax marisrubri]POG56004.1 type IV pilin [Haloferax marisrubri]